MAEKRFQYQARARRRLALGLMAFVVVLIIGYLGISAYVADKVSHPERHALTTTPAAYGLKYEDVEFASTGDDIPLKGWFIDVGASRAVVMFHGRNGTRDSASIGMMDIAAALAGHGYDVLTFDFRAHGQSGGDRYSLGQWEVRDVAGALNYLQKRGVKQIGSIGFSMGAATELLAAPDHPEMEAIVADAPFADLGELLDAQLPIASGLPGFFNPGIVFMVHTLYGVDVLDNKPERAMARLGDRPVLLIHGTADTMVPVEHTYALQQAGANDRNLETWIVPGSEHVQSYKDHPQEYLDRMIAFFDRNVR